MNYYATDRDLDTLSHHGILGQKWGIRRYQNSDGSLTAEGRTRYRQNEDGTYSKLSAKERIAATKKYKSQKKALESARKAKEAAAAQRKKDEELERDKTKILNSGSASDVMKLKGKVSNEELQRAVNRLNLERQLSEIQAKEQPKIKTGREKIQDIISTGRTIADAVQTGTDAYNRFAKVYNTFNKGGTKLKIIGEKEQQEDKSASEILSMLGKNKASNLRDSVSDSELKKASDRLKLEKQIDDYLSGNNNSFKASKNDLDDILERLDELEKKKK